MSTAFNNDTKLAERIRKQVQKHYDADEIIHGKYWEDGKGCAVGCIIHGSSHSLFQSRLGIPTEIAYLLDGLFEALPNGEAKELPRRFVNAIRPGADLSMVIPKFLYWLLADPKDGVIRFVPEDKFPQQHKAVMDVAELRRREVAGETISAATWAAARDAVWDAARAAARAAVWDAARAAARAAARDAARAAARDAVWDAARDAARAAARDAVWDAAYKRMGDKLIELLAEAA